MHRNEKWQPIISEDSGIVSKRSARNLVRKKEYSPVQPGVRCPNHPIQNQILGELCHQADEFTSASSCLISIQMISSFFSLSLTFTLRFMIPIRAVSSLLIDAEV